MTAGEFSFDETGSRALTALAARASSAAHARVTFIAPDGRIVGDSEVAHGDLPQVENHADRPEIREALAGRHGTGTWRSSTVGRELLY